jgi:hypothetical protein
MKGRIYFMLIKNEQLPSKYTDIKYEYDSDGIFYIKFIPETEMHKYIGFYPLDICFDEEGEINSVVILWPPHVWKRLDRVEFPKEHMNGRLIFEGILEEDNEYSFDVYATPDLLTLYLESEKVDRSYIKRDVQCYSVNKNFLLEIDNESNSIVRLWFKNVECQPSPTLK